MEPAITPATVLGAILTGAIAAYLAHRRGRSPYKWFFIGSFFGIYGLCTIFFFPRKNEKIPSVGAEKAPPAIPLPVIRGPADKFWYYLDPAHEQQGPMSLNALTSALLAGKISLSTYVWNEEMSEWKALEEFVRP